MSCVSFLSYFQYHHFEIQCITFEEALLGKIRDTMWDKHTFLRQVSAKGNIHQNKIKRMCFCPIERNTHAV